jgi:hypothetical protein
VPGEQGAEAAIELVEVVKTFGSERALDEANLAVPRVRSRC